MITRVTCTYGPYNAWAHAYLDDEMGTLLICSDGGNYTHRWGLSGLPTGVSFSEFIFGGCRERFDYVTDKLHYGRDDREMWDEERTKSNARRAMAQWARKELRGLPSQRDVVARYCRDAVIAIDEARSKEDFIFDIDFAIEAVGAQYDVIEYKPSYSFLRLRDEILPALQRAYHAMKETP